MGSVLNIAVELVTQLIKTLRPIRKLQAKGSSRGVQTSASVIYGAVSPDLPSTPMANQHNWTVTNLNEVELVESTRHASPTSIENEQKPKPLAIYFIRYKDNVGQHDTHNQWVIIHQWPFPVY